MLLRSASSGASDLNCDHKPRLSLRPASAMSVSASKSAFAAASQALRRTAKGRSGARSVRPIVSRDHVLDQAGQRRHIAIAERLVRHGSAEEVVHEHLEHHDADFGLERHPRHSLPGSLLARPERGQAFRYGFPEGLLELVELLRLKETGGAERGRGKTLLVPPQGPICIEQRVFARRPRDARRRRGITIELARLVAGRRQHGADERGVPRHEHVRQAGYVEIAVMSSRAGFTVGVHGRTSRGSESARGNSRDAETAATGGQGRRAVLASARNPRRKGSRPSSGARGGATKVTKLICLGGHCIGYLPADAQRAPLPLEDAAPHSPRIGDVVADHRAAHGQ